MRNTHTSKQTSKRSTYTFCRIFWIFLHINKKNFLDAQIKESSTKISITTNTYDESHHNTNASPTAPQFSSLIHNHPLSIVPPSFRKLTLTSITSSRPNYIQSPIHHIVTQQSQSDDTYEQIIEQPHTTNFQSQNNHFYSPR